MTTYVEIVDYLPRTTWTGEAILDRTDFPGLPDPMIDMIERLTLSPEGEMTCSRPDCDTPVGWYLDDSDDQRPRNGWSFAGVVWDSGKEQVGDQQSGYRYVDRLVLALCEDHTPEDPYHYDPVAGAL